MKIAARTKGAILLATDFSRPARRAYTYGLKLASVLKSRLILLHIVKAPPGFETWSPAARRSLEPLKTKALLELGRMIRTAEDSGVTARYKLVVGIPEDSILKIANESRADLIAMGTHGRTGWDRLQLGSTAETILRYAPCPVLTVHAAIVADAPLNQHRLKLSRILVAVDLSASSEAALRYAAGLAKRLNTQAVLVHASAPSSPLRLEEAHGGASHKVHQWFQQTVSTSQAGQVVSGKIVAARDPVEVILDQAKRVKADLIVMGSAGRRGVERLVLGSVAESVVRRAGCPVLVVKAGVRERRDA
jgi:nucleotide-binding universal stress UspA family protein